MRGVQDYKEEHVGHEHYLEDYSFRNVAEEGTE